MYYYTVSDLYLAVLVVTGIKISIYNEASYFENIRTISIMLSNQWLKSNVANYHVNHFSDYAAEKYGVTQKEIRKLMTIKINNIIKCCKQKNEN